MEGYLIRGSELNLPGCGETSALAPGATLAARGLMSPSQSAISSWGGVSTPRGAVSIRAVSVFVPGLLELWIYGRISDPGMGNYPPRVRRDLGVGPRGNSRSALAS